MISAALGILETEEQRSELAEFYDQNKSLFYAIAYSKLHNRFDAEDAIQEAFLIFRKKRVSYINVIIRNISYKVWGKTY